MTHFYENCGNDKPLSIIAGPCVFESRDHAIMMASELKNVCDYAAKSRPVNFIYKTSFDKANRTSADSFRGVHFDEAYYGFEAIQNLGIQVLTDVHENWECGATNADILQIPAFLCRQTNLLKAAAETGKPINVKKGQFAAPLDMVNVVKKLEKFGCDKIMLTERGTTFGYNNLVVDFRSIPVMQSIVYPVIFDATHSVQSPGGLGNKSGGDREMAKFLARAAAGIGVAGIFLEVHQDPDNAPSDGPNMIRLRVFRELLSNLIELDIIAKKWRNVV